MVHKRALTVALLSTSLLGLEIICCIQRSRRSRTV